MYRIADQPVKNRFAQWVCAPSWPLFAVMFGGAGLSWAWFTLNAFAISSPGRFVDAAIAATGFALNAVMFLGIVLLLGNGLVTEQAAPYLLLVLTIWKLGVSYVLFSRQRLPFEVYRYYNPIGAFGMQVVFVGAIGRALIERPAWVSAVFF